MARSPKAVGFFERGRSPRALSRSSWSLANAESAPCDFVLIISNILPCDRFGSGESAATGRLPTARGGASPPPPKRRRVAPKRGRRGVALDPPCLRCFGQVGITTAVDAGCGFVAGEADYGVGRTNPRARCSLRHHVNASPTKWNETAGGNTWHLSNVHNHRFAGVRGGDVQGTRCSSGRSSERSR